MLRRCSRLEKGTVAVLVGVTILACNLQFATPGEGQESSAPPAETATNSASATPEPSAAPTQTATDSATETATATVGPPPVVTVAASGGRLNVRRGPGPEYDTVGAFLDGQSTTATARNGDGSWVLINTPDTSKSLGWIIVKTQYTTVRGTVANLPVLEVDSALPAYIRNCTPHEMLVNPGGALLLERSNSPENQLQFFPGEYSVIDQTTESEVAGVTVFEGRTIDVKKDSSGKSFSCP
ncbi:MAG: hypothetical protein V1755_04070 [Chloroflexota bacterium]